MPRLTFSMAEMQLDGAAAGVVAPRIQNDGNNQRSKALPVSVHIVDGHGYVWDADGENEEENATVNGD